MDSEKTSIDINDGEIDDVINNNINKDIYDEINKINNENEINNEKDVDFNKQTIDKPIIEVSPRGTYLVTYNPKDHSIVGWNAVSAEEGQLAKDITITIDDDCIDQICVSDDKKLAYMVIKNNDCYPKIIDIHRNQVIKLDLITGCFDDMCHTFNLKGEYILYSNWSVYNSIYDEVEKVIWIYSTQTKNNKWFCIRIYKLPEYFELINVSKYDKFYLFSNNSIYEWNLDTEQDIKIFHNKEFEKENKSYCIKRELRNDIKISSNNMFICLRIMDKIIITSIELTIPIVTLDMNNDTSLYNLIKYFDLIPSLPSLLPLLNSKIRDSIIGSKYENIQTTDEYAFGILDGCVWKIKFEDYISEIKFSFQNSDKQVQNRNYHCDEHFITLFNPYMDKIRELFQKVSKSENEYKKKIEQNYIDLFEQNIITVGLLQVWKIKVINHNKIMLRVFKKVDVSNKWELTCTRITKFNIHNVRQIKLLEIKLFTNDDIILITTIGFLICHFNENEKSISLNYWNYLELTSSSIGTIEEESDDFSDFKTLLKPYTSKHNLPLSSYDSFKTSDDWISYVKDNKENLLKYGNELLSFAIKEHRLDLIEEIYKECMNRFKEDLGNNWMVLSIITSTLPLLHKHYPEYVFRYSLETTMIIDHPIYNIEYRHNNLHLYSFQYLQLVDLTRSILWSKYNYFLSNHESIYGMLILIQISMIILLLPFFFIYIAIFHILLRYHFVNDIFSVDILSSIYQILLSKLAKDKIPMITFMVPYIKFVNYPRCYNWFIELFKPQSSPFVETISRDIYKTWNGEAIINFKWNTYGKYYYMMIWIGFMAYLGCFTAAATIPQQLIDDDIQKRLLIASIILGFIHLSFEVRQIIFSPIKWLLDFWNLFDMIAYLLPIYTSIYWLQINEMNDSIISLLSFSCLFLDLKFLLFFRAFEYFGVSDFSLDTRSINNDPNNPWNLATTYNQIFENGTVDSNPFLIQPPNGNTNMFVDFRTSLFAMYKFLTGDSSALSNWTYISDPPLVILIVLFSLLIVVYLMNLFIGLLNNAIEKDYNRVSYLMQKAQILAEIELYYMLPYQRRRKEWFPEIMYYYANLDDIQKEVKRMMEQNEWSKVNAFPVLKQDLLKKINIQLDPDDQ
ncbi:hypothetical protein GLOIN_2v1874127 [Rhizophagus clarus]|uniref:Ion transport domain-containing protein n=1 Tax=Rhizophagus clarus TaxID=94130 RepID=A0A8H3MCC6_9GLOM|nr:hypothetical protein GLOIN_2v1874127 [Rhizophagus clarus]